MQTIPASHKRRDQLPKANPTTMNRSIIQLCQTEFLLGSDTRWADEKKEGRIKGLFPEFLCLV